MLNIEVILTTVGLIIVMWSANSLLQQSQSQ